MAEGKSKTGVVKKRASKREKKDWIAAYIFIAPVTLGLLVFYIWPFIQNIWFSFNEVSKFNVATFCGLANYQKLFRDGEVLKTFGNTLKYVVVTVPVGLFLSILIATLLNSKIKGTSIYRTLYFLPSVTMAAAVAMVWKWIYNEKMGILNSVIRALGGKGIGWLTDPKIALYSVMIVGLWMSVGYNMIILLAGMQGISKSYYEAAQIDGAGPVQLFFKVTIPLLTPTIFFVMITSIISGFQVFDVIYMMIGKTNPAYANTQTVVMLFYRQAFDYGYKGYAAAISILIFAAIMLVTVIQMIVQSLGLLDTIPALFLPNLFSAFGTFLLRQFFMSLPKELEEAALLDGCNRFQIFGKIMLPLTKAGIVSLVIFTAKFAWNDFMWPLIVNTSMDKMTLGPALSTLQGQYTTKYPMQMAGAVMAVIPIIVLFFIFQKQFIEGVAQSGIKG